MPTAASPHIYESMPIRGPVHGASLDANRAVHEGGLQCWVEAAGGEWQAECPSRCPVSPHPTPSRSAAGRCDQCDHEEQCRSPRTRSPQPQLGRYHIAIAVLRAVASPRQWPDVAGHKQGCGCMTSAGAARRPCRWTSTPRCPARPLLSRHGQRISQAGSHRRVRNGRSPVAADANGNEHI
jgi:hypothetical protein